MGVTLSARGKFRKSRGFLEHILGVDYEGILDQYGQMGVENLSALTPVRSGTTAGSWSFQRYVSKRDGYAYISWWNSNVNDGVPIALVIEYGHVTGWGGYVPPHPYIEEAIVPVIEALKEELWEEVTSG